MRHIIGFLVMFVLSLAALAGFVAGIYWIWTGWIELQSAAFYRWMIWELILTGALVWTAKRYEKWELI